MKSKFILICVGINLGILLSVSIILFDKFSISQVYVNNQQLFDGFVMKEELQSKLHNYRIRNQGYLDSLLHDFQHNGYKTEAETDMKRERYLRVKSEILNSEQNIEEQYTTQIWTQINQYVSDYGDEYDLDFIIGTTGSGNLMYSSAKHNETEKILEYINNKYKGLKK